MVTDREPTVEQDIPDFNLRKAVDLAVITEQNGRQYYQRLAKRFDDEPELGRIFAQLARDEELHEQQFRRLRDGLPAEEPGEKQAKPFGANYLRAISLSKFFSAGAFDRTEEISEPKDALIQALELEKATKFYYHELAEQLDDSGALDEIIAEERRHIETLLKVILTDARFRGLFDQWH